MVVGPEHPLRDDTLRDAYTLHDAYTLRDAHRAGDVSVACIVRHVAAWYIFSKVRSHLNLLESENHSRVSVNLQLDVLHKMNIELQSQ